jgi:phosphatidylglycerol:prolipoprotein diacylglycerol transferase
VSSLSAITIGIDPTIELGPITLAWHGLTIVLGILAGAAVAASDLRRRRLSTEPLHGLVLCVTAGALLGGRAFYLAEHGQLTQPSAWLGSHGFTFNGGLIAAAAATAAYVWRQRLSAVYLDTLAAALPLGILIGRIGDVINGEHYGPPTDSPLGVRNAHPDALVPSPDVAYHSGGLYEVLLAALVLAVVWPLRNRLRAPTATVWLVLALLAAGRFLEFFLRSDSATGPLGLTTAQWTSAAMFAVALAAAGRLIVKPQMSGDRSLAIRGSRAAPPSA